MFVFLVFKATVQSVFYVTSLQMEKNVRPTIKMAVHPVSNRAISSAKTVGVLPSFTWPDCRLSQCSNASVHGATEFILILIKIIEAYIACCLAEM